MNRADLNLRTTGLLLLLPAEGMLLGLLFDAESLAALPRGWWSPLREIAPQVMPVAAAVATSGLLLAGPRIREQLRRRPAGPVSPRRTGAFLAGHLLAFAAFFGLTSVLFDGRLARERIGAGVAAWLAAGALTALLWAGALLPGHRARVLIRQSWPLLLGSVACGLIAWAAGHYTQPWWDPLRRATLLAAAPLLRAVDGTAWSDPAQHLIGAGRFTVEVNRQCSGAEGVGLGAVALGAWFALYRAHLRFPRVLLLLPVALAAVWLANVLRIAALVYIGAHGSREVAVGGFHSYAGVLLFSAVVLSTAWVAYHSPFFAKDIPLRPRAGRNPAAPYLVPLLLLTAAGLLTGLFSREHAGASDPLYPVRVAVGGIALWLYRHRYRGLDWTFSTVPILVGAAVFVLWVGLTGSFEDPSLRPPPAPPPWGHLWLAFRILGAVAVVPVVEELAFRGYLARRLMAADFTGIRLTELSWTAVLVSSLVFGMLHQQFLAGVAAGLAYALVARYRGRLSDAIVAHAVTNALLAGVAVAS